MEAWHGVGNVSDFDFEVPGEVRIKGLRLAVHHTHEGFFVTGAVCTHEDENLVDGLLDGCEIECPKHMAIFDVRTGAALCAPARVPLATYPCEVRGTELWVLIRAEGSPMP